MKISRLYIKLFIIFIIALVFSQILVFTGWHLLNKKRWDDNLPAHIEGQIKLIQALAIQRDLKLNDYQSIHDFARELANIYSGKIWIYKSGKLLVQSHEKAKWPDSNDWHRHKQIKFRFDIHDGVLISVPFKIQFNEVLELRIHLFSKKGPGHRLLMVLTGVIVAFLMLIWPIYRILNKPILDLQKATRRLANGQLQATVEIQSSDELGQLCQNFNTMAQRIQELVANTHEMNARFSHELRSPLTRMKMELELLKNKQSPSEAGHIKGLTLEIDILDRIIGQVLDMAKARAGFQQIPQKNLDLKKWIKKELENNKTIIQNKNIELDLQFRSSPMLQVPDPYFRQALRALIDNAVNYNSFQGYLKIILTDSKLAIINSIDENPHEEIHNLTKPFVRGTTKIDGTGLGLSIAHSVFKHCRMDLHIEISEGMFIANVLY